MRASFHALLVVLLAFAATHVNAAGFTYRGQLEDDGVPAEGRYDLRLTLYAEREALHPVAAVELFDIVVSNGRFAAPVDFSDLPVDLDTGWLEVAVRSGDDGAFWPLPQRQQVSTKGATCPAGWALSGNAGTDPASQFLGTSDNQSLVLRVNDQPALRLVPRPNGPNLVAGHPANSAPLSTSSTIGGGGSSSAPNEISSSTGSTIGGGVGNHTLGDFTTVAGGHSNRARNPSSTVGGGSFNSALADWATVAGGQNNLADQAFSMVSGGSGNCAGGEYSWAGGRNAKVRPPGSQPTGPCAGAPSGLHGGDRGTFVWADSTDADFISTGINQFLVRATGGVGFNTNNPVTTFDVVGVRSGHIGLISNLQTGVAHGLAIRINVGTPTTSNNFLTFQRNNGGSIGSVEGNGSGGVVFNTSGGDYAEFLPKADPAAIIIPGSVVGIRGGSVSLDTRDAEQLAVVSSNPALSGNDPGAEARDAHVLVAFLGQVDVRVRGAVQAGDFLVASGADDGVAVAVPAAALTSDQAGRVLGRAWASTSEDSSLVRALVSLSPNEAALHQELAALRRQQGADMADLRREHQEDLAMLRQELLALREMLAPAIAERGR